MVGQLGFYDLDERYRALSAAASRLSVWHEQLDASKNLVERWRWRLNRAMPKEEMQGGSAGFLRPRGSTGAAVGQG